jgi:transposase InsO family protein
MNQKLHRNAKTNYLIRQEIRQSTESITSLASRYHLSWPTVKKWKTRDKVEDKSSRPDKTRTTLTKYQEDLILFDRKKFKKTVDEIYFSLDDQIPNLYPVKVYRCLARYGLSVLPDELLKAERQIKKFRKYTLGYLHIDVLYTPKINKKRWYAFTAIDRVTKIAFVWVTDRKTKEMGAMFLNKVLTFYPYPIHYILTDNGFEFTYKALIKCKRTTKTHPFDLICQHNKIDHRTIKFKHPWTNGMVERFNGKVKTKVFRRYLFEDIEDLNEKLVGYLNSYNFEVRLKQLKYQTPAVYLKTNYNHSIQRIVI